MDYISQNHSKHLLMVHLIFVCKYRKQLLIKFGEQIKEIFTNIAEEHNINVVEMEVDKDHIHLLVQYNLTQSVLEVLDILNKYLLTEYGDETTIIII